MAAVTEVKVPDIGDFKDVPIIEVFVKQGDSVKAEDPLITLESDKATMDVPAPSAGTVKALKVKVGDKVSEGSAILTLEAAGAARSACGAAVAAVAAAEDPLAAGGACRCGGGAFAAAAPAPLASRVISTLPSLTLSPTLARRSFTTPAAGDGTSIVALSDSSVTRESSGFTVSPGLTNTSMIGTSLKSPMSGTLTSIVLMV